MNVWNLELEIGLSMSLPRPAFISVNLVVLFSAISLVNQRQAHPTSRYYCRCLHRTLMPPANLQLLWYTCARDDEFALLRAPCASGRGPGSERLGFC
jgi:hypothetical protein